MKHSNMMVTKPSTWFALYTRHQHEKTVAQSLSGKGVKVFLPLYVAPHRWKDRVKRVTLPLFPNYVFVDGAQERKFKVLSTPGVYDFVRFGGSPTPIPNEEIEAVRRVTEQGKDVMPYSFLKVGDRVRVRSEPLKGLEGILVRKKNLSRLVLSVELLARSIAVEVDIYNVERVKTLTTGSGLPVTSIGNERCAREGR